MSTKIELLLHTVLLKPELVEDADEVIRSARMAGIEVQLDKRMQAAIEYGIVVSVGPTAFKEFGRGPDILKPGDRVTFAKYCGKSIEINGEKFLICNDEDILGVLKDE